MREFKRTKWGTCMCLLLAAAMMFSFPVVPRAGADDVTPVRPASGAQANSLAATAPSGGEALKAAMPGKGNVTVNFKEVDILTVLNYLSEVSGVDIIPSPGVESKVTMRLRDKPWEQALDIVTRNYGYVYSREGDVIRVIPKGQAGMEEPITEVIKLNNLIREIELTKGSVSGTASTLGTEVTVKQQEQSIQQLMSAINSMLDAKRGEKATFVSGVNSIIVTAIPSKISEIKKMILGIDKRPPQIILDTKVVEISLTDDERFGVDWNAIISAAGARKAITFPFTNTGVIPFLPSDQRQFYPASTDITGAALTGQNDFPYVNMSNMLNAVTQTAASNAANMFSFGTLDFTTFTATLSLLENRGDTEILSSPRITTLNNQKATIKVIEKMMLQKSVATTQTATLVTVEFESEDEAREVGIKLTVIPHVNENNEISVNLLPEVSSNAGFNSITVGAAAATTVALTFLSREANTTVRANDGETIFLGGLIRKNTVKTDNKLPIIGDLFGGIPLIGNAFKYEADNITRTEIVFFVTVHLVKDGMDSIEKASSVDRYNEYVKNARPVVPPAADRGDKDDVRSEGIFGNLLGNRQAVREEEHPPVIIQKAGLKTTEETVKVSLPQSQAVEPKKTAAPLFDFRKK